MKDNTQKIMYSFRIDPKLLEKLQKIAENQERSTSNLIHHILRSFANLSN